MKKILLIDDEKNFCYFVKKNLELTGEFTVFTANDGREGIEIARRDKPNLILLDVLMPGMLGSDVVAQMQEDPELSKIPVVFLTAVVQKDDFGEDLIKKSGGHLFLAKPITPGELVSAIKKILEEEVKEK